MKLQARIKRLELRGNIGAASDSKERLLALLDGLEAQAQASGDTVHSEGASVAENLARARVRGDRAAWVALWQGICDRHGTITRPC